MRAGPEQATMHMGIRCRTALSLVFGRRNKEIERSVEEVIRLAEHSPHGDANSVRVPDSAKADFRQHYSQRMCQVMCRALIGPWISFVRFSE
jgi:hypothetical protein